MRERKTLDINSLLQLQQGVTYKGEIAVLLSERGSLFRLLDGEPVRVNGFTYALVLSGEATLRSDGVDNVIDDHTICVLTPLNLAGFSRPSADFQCLFLTVGKAFVDRLSDDHIPTRVVRGMNIFHAPFFQIDDLEKPALRDAIDHVRRCICRTDHLYHLKLVQNALERFYLEIENVFDGKPGRDTFATLRQRDMLQRFVGLAMGHYMEQHHVAYYADRMSVTPQYLTRVVKRLTGRSVSEFIYEMVYGEVRNLLLATDLSVDEIAERAHFADQSSLCKFFRARTGVPPAAFRRRR